MSRLLRGFGLGRARPPRNVGTQVGGKTDHSPWGKKGHFWEGGAFKASGGGLTWLLSPPCGLEQAYAKRRTQDTGPGTKGGGDCEERGGGEGDFFELTPETRGESVGSFARPTSQFFQSSCCSFLVCQNNKEKQIKILSCWDTSSIGTSCDDESLRMGSLFQDGGGGDERSTLKELQAKVRHKLKSFYPLYKYDKFEIFQKFISRTV